MNVSESLVNFTESYLTRRREKQFIRKEKSRRRHFLIDWLDAFLWAAGVVLLLNQYLLQAYQIPTPSMESTLMVGDRIFVNKLVYGPELIPGRGKLPSPIHPSRGDVIIFENPTYISRGPGFDILQRVLYMLTLSMVDIDRNPDGTPKHHFLIKRAAAADGDRVRNVEGNMLFLPEGESQWISETTYRERIGQENKTQRLIPQENYPVIQKAARAMVHNELGLPVTQQEREALLQVQSDRSYQDAYMLQNHYPSELLWKINPAGIRYQRESIKRTIGFYVPHGWILPLGDNRDNSKDGRSFGVIKKDEVLGQASIKYWPLSRFGLIK